MKGVVIEVGACNAHLSPLPEAQAKQVQGPASLQEGEAHLVSNPKEAEFGLLPIPTNDKCV